MNLTKIENSFFLGDCLEILPKHIGDKSVDLILCDMKNNNK